MLSKRELGAIRGKLPAQGYQRIADKTGLSTSMVGKALRDPKHFNALIIEKALEVIEEYREQVAHLKLKVKEIVQ